MYKVAKMFKVYQTDFYDQCFETLLLSGPGVGILQFLAETHRNLHILPFMHIQGSPRIIQIDYNNTFGHGHRAILNAAVDRRKFLIIAKSI